MRESKRKGRKQRRKRSNIAVGSMLRLKKTRTNVLYIVQHRNYLTHLARIISLGGRHPWSSSEGLPCQGDAPTDNWPRLPRLIY